MTILAELKLAFVEILSETQKNVKYPSNTLNQFLESATNQMAEAESAVDLAQSIRHLCEELLPQYWLNPLWYFSPEYQLRTHLLKILNDKHYSLLNLLIRSHSEDRQLIKQLRAETFHVTAGLDGSAITPGLLNEYQHKLTAYHDRYLIDQRRQEELSKATDELIEENIRLKSSQPALILLSKLTKQPGFNQLVASIELTTEETCLIRSLPAEVESNRVTNCCSH